MSSDRTPPDSFLDALLKWMASTYGLALLPLIAKLIVTHGPYGAESCLFVLVLGASGGFEAAFTTKGSWATRTFLIVTALFSVFYGATGYAELSSGQVFPAIGLLWWAAGVLSLAYLIYKVPLLWETNG
jgi:hypothetical protein